MQMGATPPISQNLPLSMRLLPRGRLISSILCTAADLVTLPQDMRLNNFQQDIGGTVEGLIGIIHIQQIPVPVFHLQNGLSIFRHALRPAGNINRIYCLGDSLPALTEFKRRAGSDYHNILYSSIGDRDSCNTLLFDGDFMNGSVRGQPLLGNAEWREEQSLAVCQQLQGSTTMQFSLARTTQPN